MTFLMSCMRGESPHCHCHSPASPREQALRDSMRAAWWPPCRQGCLLLWQRPGDAVPGSSLCCLLHCMQFGSECENALWAFTFLCQFGLYCLNPYADLGRAGGQRRCGANMESVCIETPCTVIVVR